MISIYKLIIGIAVPAVIFGIFVLLIASNVAHMLENSERWMVELDTHLDLSPEQLETQLRKENLKDLILYRTVTLESYFESLGPNLERQAKETFDTEHRFVVHIDENHKYSKQQIQEIFSDVNGIRESKHLHDWLLGKD